MKRGFAFLILMGIFLFWTNIISANPSSCVITGTQTLDSNWGACENITINGTLISSGYNISCTNITINSVGLLNLTAGTFLMFNDTALAGFGASTGDLVCGGNITRGVTVTSKSQPPVNYWDFTTSMDVTADYTSFSYADKFQPSQGSSDAVDVDNCNFSFMSSVTAGVYITYVTSFTNNIINSCKGGLAIRTSYTGFDNIQITNNTGYDVKNLWDSNLIIEFNNSNFNEANTQFIGTGNTLSMISKNHNDLRSNFQIIATTNFNKSQITNDFGALDNVTIRGNFTINEAWNYSGINVASNGNLSYAYTGADVNVSYSKVSGGYVNILGSKILTSSNSTFNGGNLEDNTTGASYWVDSIESGSKWIVNALNIVPAASNYIQTPSEVFEDIISDNLNITISVNWYDYSGVDSCIAMTTQSGSYANYTPTSWNNTFCTFVINASDLSYGETVNWKFWANDTTGLSATSSVNSFTVQNRTFKLYMAPIYTQTEATDWGTWDRIQPVSAVFYGEGVDAIPAGSGYALDWGTGGTSGPWELGASGLNASSINNTLRQNVSYFAALWSIRNAAANDIEGRLQGDFYISYTGYATPTVSSNLTFANVSHPLLYGIKGMTMQFNTSVSGGVGTGTYFSITNRSKVTVLANITVDGTERECIIAVEDDGRRRLYYCSIPTYSTRSYLLDDNSYAYYNQFKKNALHWIAGANETDIYIDVADTPHHNDGIVLVRNDDPSPYYNLNWTVDLYNAIGTQTRNRITNALVSINNGTSYTDCAGAGGEGWYYFGGENGSKYPGQGPGEAQDYLAQFKAWDALGSDMDSHGKCHERYSEYNYSTQLEFANWSRNYLNTLFDEEIVGITLPGYLYATATQYSTNSSVIDAFAKAGYSYTSGRSDGGNWTECRYWRNNFSTQSYECDGVAVENNYDDYTSNYLTRINNSKNYTDGYKTMTFNVHYSQFESNMTNITTIINDIYHNVSFMTIKDKFGYFDKARHNLSIYTSYYNYTNKLRVKFNYPSSAFEDELRGIKLYIYSKESNLQVSFYDINENKLGYYFDNASSEYTIFAEPFYTNYSTRKFETVNMTTTGFKFFVGDNGTITVYNLTTLLINPVVYDSTDDVYVKLTHGSYIFNVTAEHEYQLQEGKSNGVSCSSAYECAGGYCNSGLCASSSPSSAEASASTSDTNHGSFTGTFKPSLESLENGYSVNLGKNQKVEITVNDEKETVTVDSISEDKVVISIGGESYDIAEGGTVKIDSNCDGYYDTEVENIGISGNYVNLKFTLINEEIPKNEEEGKGTGNVTDEISESVKEKWYVYAIMGVVVLGLILYLIWNKYKMKKRYRKYGY